MYTNQMPYSGRSMPFTGGFGRAPSTNRLDPFARGNGMGYGSTKQHDQGPAPTKNGLAHLPLASDGTNRARFDFQTIFVSAIIPALVFTVVAGLLGFHFHFSSPLIVWLLVVCCLAPAAYYGMYAVMVPLNHPTNAKWLMFACVMSLLAWVFGVVIGNMIYSQHMNPYYELLALNLYPSADPAAPGDAFTDAGRVVFQPGSRLDFSKAMGVKVTDTYCVVPVVKGNGNSTTGDYAFWAVGINCCSSIQPASDFTCKMTDDYTISAGMRWMDDSTRPFFRMAVQEAEATYKIQVKHPVFLKWMLDPTAELGVMSASGWHTYLKYVWAFLLAMCVLSVVAGFALSASHMTHEHCKGTGFQKYMLENPDHDPLDEEDLEIRPNN
jgi:hypothetical protein